MIGVIIVGNTVYYVQNEKIIGRCSLNELGGTTQTTVTITKEVN